MKADLWDSVYKCIFYVIDKRKNIKTKNYYYYNLTVFC